MALFTKQRPLHAAITEAEAKVKDHESQLADAKGKLTEIQTKRDQVERDLREARVSHAMGHASSRPMTELKAELEIVHDNAELAEARCTGLQRAISSAQEKVEATTQALRRAQWSLVESLAAQRVKAMNERAFAFQQDQRELAALAFAVMDAGFHPDEITSIIPVYMLHSEIVANYGTGTRRVWPEMGDRRTDRSLLTAQIEAVNEELRNL